MRRHDFVARDLPSHRLKDVARHFGVAAPERVYLAGADIVRTYGQQPELVRRYALADVAEVDALARRLLGPPFALAGMAPRRYERVACAGRLKKAFAPADFDQIFRLDGQLGLFDQPLAVIEPLWMRCAQEAP